uniref:Uncharacterized protein n=1 Tax=Romanomermis culicivorax TaxID=13658 RepID=A0A915JZI6_ROMCU
MIVQCVQISTASKTTGDKDDITFTATRCIGNPDPKLSDHFVAPEGDILKILDQDPTFCHISTFYGTVVLLTASINDAVQTVDHDTDRPLPQITQIGRLNVKSELPDQSVRRSDQHVEPNDQKNVGQQRLLQLLNFGYHTELTLKIRRTIDNSIIFEPRIDPFHNQMKVLSLLKAPI